MRARHAAEERAVRERRSKLEKFVEYGLALLELGVLPESQPAAPKAALASSRGADQKPAPKKQRTRGPRKGTRTWTATIKRIVVQAGSGMTYAELKAKLMTTHLAGTLRKTDKALYTSVGKLNERGDIVKHNGRLYSPKAFRRFMEDVAAGRAVDAPAPIVTGGESPNEIAVDRFLKSLPDGATASEIVNSLLNNPPADLAVTKNKNSIYNLLSRHLKSEKLIRRGERYYLPTSKDEAPGSEEPSAPNHHDDESGTSASTGNGRLASLDAAPGAIPAHPGE